jgi:putative Holliday junction resolvase
MYRNMAFWLGIDHGSKRIGVAGGAVPPGIASPMEMVPAQPEHVALERIATIAREHGAAGIVVGLPLNMDDSAGPQAKLAREFAERVAAAIGLDVRLWDERLTSFAADQALAGRLTRGKRKSRQDALAAAAMLQGFFDANGPDAAPRVARTCRGRPARA